MQNNRSIDLIYNIVKKLNLNLKGFSVLTEAGTGYYIFTAIIALVANAKYVMIWVNDSSYGEAKSIKKEFEGLATKLGYKNYHFTLNERPIDDIRKADIITNLGHIRPINKKFLINVKPSSVISTMSEKWELRKEDIDIIFCKKNNIKVAGTWENHPKLKIFDNCGYLIAKMCFESGFEIFQNNILIISSDNFGKVAFEKLKNFEPNELKLSNLKSINHNLLINNPELIIIADYTTNIELIGEKGLIDISLLKNITIVHLCGKIDYEYCIKNEINLFPNQNGNSFRMSKTLAHLGAKPVIDLHAAGFKVGENMLRGINSKLNQPIV
jgi:hypothetical protein